MDLTAVLSSDVEPFGHDSGGLSQHQTGSGHAGMEDSDFNPRQDHRDAPADIDMRRVHVESREELEVSGVVTIVTVDAASRKGWTAGMLPGG